MLFNSGIFLFFFIIVYFFYLLSNRKAQNVVLLFGSYLFYSYWDYRFLILVLISTLIDYFSALAISHHHELKNNKQAKRWLLLSVISNFSILVFFKYYGFFAASFSLLLTKIGVKLDTPTLQIILPLGISFYTFQTVSYTIDVYKSKIKPTSNLLNFAVYVSFFPQLIAGPIERAKSLLTQIEKERVITVVNIQRGSWLLFWGLFKKIVIADNLAPYTFWSYAKLGAKSGLDYWVNSFAFSLRFYCDFSGYSDMAVGLGLFFGISLSQNFNLPFFATNPSEFWRRWHITLTRWFTDYVYFPLKRKLGDNLMARFLTAITTMTLVGLWHGGKWSLVIWGLSWGLVITLYRLLLPTLRRVSTKSIYIEKLLSFFGIVLVFILWVGLGTLFYVENYHFSLKIMNYLFFDWSYSERTLRDFITVLYYSWPLIIIQLVQFKTKDLDFILKTPRFIRISVYCILLLLFIGNGAIGEKEFLYFQF